MIRIPSIKHEFLGVLSKVIVDTSDLNIRKIFRQKGFHPFSHLLSFYSFQDHDTAYSNGAQFR